LEIDKEKLIDNRNKSIFDKSKVETNRLLIDSSNSELKFISFALKSIKILIIVNRLALQVHGSLYFSSEIF